jgi:hypothetical protein
MITCRGVTKTVLANGAQVWRLDDQLHREDGPALIWSGYVLDGICYWRGKLVSPRLQSLIQRLRLEQKISSMTNRPPLLAFRPHSQKGRPGAPTAYVKTSTPIPADHHVFQNGHHGQETAYNCGRMRFKY